MNRQVINRSFLLVLVLFISGVFLFMIRPFLMGLLLAGIFSALTHPLYRRLCRWLGNRQALASAVTLLIVVLVVLLPLTGLLAVVTAQAVKVGQSITPWIQKQLATPTSFSDWLGHLPFYEHVLPTGTRFFKRRESWSAP